MGITVLPEILIVPKIALDLGTTTMAETKTVKKQIPKLLPNFGWILLRKLLLLTFQQSEEGIPMVFQKIIDPKTGPTPYQGIINTKIKNLSSLETNEIGIVQVNPQELQAEETSVLIILIAEVIPITKNKPQGSKIQLLIPN